jgi:hypothetical protein
VNLAFGALGVALGIALLALLGGLVSLGAGSEAINASDGETNKTGFFFILFLSLAGGGISLLVGALNIRWAISNLRRSRPYV